MIIKNRWFWLYAGYDMSRNVSASFDLAILPRPEEHRIGDLLPALLRINCSWEWLPKIVWVPSLDWQIHGDPNAVNSTRWTGCGWKFYEWHWPFSFSVSR